MPKNIIAVIGATGAQGGGLVRAILADANSAFAVRAITRDSGSQGARSLAEAGAEIVAGDLDDPKSIRAAFEGAYGAYCVTFFGAHFSPEKELQHANDMAEAAKDAGVHHVIWSTLEDTRNFVPLNSTRTRQTTSLATPTCRRRFCSSRFFGITLFTPAQVPTATKTAHLS